MKTFYSLKHLQQLSPDEPAFPLVQEYLYHLVKAYSSDGISVDKDNFGFVALDGPEDIDCQFPRIGGLRLDETNFETVTLEKNHYVAFFVSGSDYVEVHILNSALAKGKLREHLEYYRID